MKLNKFIYFLISIISIPILLIHSELSGINKVAHASGSPFVGKFGSSLEVNGMPLYLIGYNYGWLGNQWCPGPSLSEIDTVFSQISKSSKGNVVREAFFQAGYDNFAFTRFDQRIAVAKKYGLYIIPILVNEWTDCEYSSTMKSLSWYQTGYKQTNDGYPLSFRDYAIKLAQHYANEPTIAWWQLVNEPDGRNLDSSCNESAAASALRSFADDMTTAVKSVDPNHMVDLGSINWCGQQGSDFQYVNAGAVDVCDSWHDYSNATNASVSDHLTACNNLHKPSFVGEAGICADVDASGNCTGTVTQATLQQRAAFFDKKMQVAFAAGIDGYIIWQKGINSRGWDVGPGDPTETILANYALELTSPVIPFKLVLLLLIVFLLFILLLLIFSDSTGPSRRR